MDVTERARVYAALGDPQRLRIVDALVVGDRTVGEIGDITGMPGNLLAHHLRVLETAGVVERRRSEGDRRRRYVVLEPSVAGLVSAGHALPPGGPLFVCTHNSARSQFAAALWRDRTGEDAASAGTDPAATVNATAVVVAGDYGLDLAEEHPRSYADVDRPPSLVVSVCDRAGESGIPFDAPHVHWSIPDPVSTGRIEAFREAFDDIALRVERVIGEPRR